MDGSDFDPTDIEPMGALIAVAFTGAVLALAGFLLASVVGEAALALAAVGLVVVAASPAAYLRFRRLA